MLFSIFNTLNRKVNASLPIWNKLENFTNTYNSNGSLNRRCFYYNRATDATISELFIGGHTNNNYQIRARASSTGAYNRLKQAIVTAGFSVLNYYTDEFLKEVHVSTEDLNRLRHFLYVIKQQERHFSLIEEEIVSSLHLVSLNLDTPLSIWDKSGDFASIFNSGGPLNRTCMYINNAANATVSELFIGGYVNNSYQIRAKALSTEAYDRLKQAVVSAGFSVSRCTEDYMKTVDVSTGDLNRLRHFLYAVKQEELHFYLIEEDIVSSLELTSLNTDTPMSTWDRRGSFTEFQHFAQGSLVVRQVKYVTDIQESLISEFSLYGYSNDTYLFSFQLNEGSSSLRNSLLNSNLPVIFDEYIRVPLIFKFTFGRNDYIQLDELLLLLSQHSLHFADIREQFKQHIAPVLNSSQLQILSFFNQIHVNNAFPTISLNQQKLDFSGFSKDILSEAEKEQYEKYCCVLSDHVMTEPVYDPRVPQYHFEKSWILHALTSKKEHPYTREPLIEEQLVLNQDLKNSIDAFVDGIISANVVRLELYKMDFK